MAYTAYDLALRTRQLLDIPQHWVKGSMAQKKVQSIYGWATVGTEPNDHLADCFCLDGGVLKALWDIGNIEPEYAFADPIYETVMRAIEDAIDMRSPDHDSDLTEYSAETVWKFNDADETAHADVIWVLDHAVDALKHREMETA